MNPPSLAFIPESAPFNDEQRAWLNGFFAGWLGVAPGAAGGSGTQETAAAEVAKPVAETEDFPWHDPALPILDRLELANEKPLPRRLMAAMAQLDCGSCGYDCKMYAEKLAAGEETNATLCSPGGKETVRTIKSLIKESAKNPGQPRAQSHGAGESEASPRWSRHNPYAARVLRTVNLNAEGSDKQTTHVELDLGDSGLCYAVGDSLGVWPTNCDELVDEMLRRLGARGDEPVPFDGDTLPLREALLAKRCLTDVTEELLICLAETADESEAAALRALIDDESSLDGGDVFDVLRRFPSAVPSPSAFVAALSPMRPRLYSISSSLRAHPNEVHLTVGRVAWENDGRVRKGVCSTQFAERVEPGATVPVFVQKSHGFTVPADPTAPMIMIGPGTGIAPFRAFLEERMATGATGGNWLFFGDRHAASDSLYRDELEAWQASGLLTRLDLAFSRDGDAKVYVQDRMRESAAELWKWLQQGASVFVCGDAKRMAVDVDAALRSIVAGQGGYSEAAAREYIAHLAQAGRYQRDVY